VSPRKATRYEARSAQSNAPNREKCDRIAMLHARSTTIIVTRDRPSQNVGKKLVLLMRAFRKYPVKSVN
jgi:hypothetical protein